MPTPEQLSAEKRKRVAEVCTGHKWKLLADRVYRTINVPETVVIEWDTVANLTDILALISTVARMIEEGAKDRDMMASVSLDRRLTHYLATNNTPQIEALLLELIEGGKDE